LPPFLIGVFISGATRYEDPIFPMARTPSDFLPVSPDKFRRDKF
jgi:hypothetical protein